ncbi:TetR/AcrR family transcriptional regulator [Methylopila henanensis]|uniref:TetR/AcrR family transcriptional regulator n=1 Tax=Methylopila henanensis TaxID=873516 RepID=A0ABW4KEY9_9HYPH
MGDTRTRVLEQAETLLRSKGYSGFSYADLEEAVGIRKASIHHHFRTKEKLALALVETYDRRYDDALDRILLASESALERVDAYGRLYLTGLEQGLGCLCAALAIENDTLPATLRKNVAAFFAKHVDWLKQVIADGVARGEVRDRVDPSDFARMTVGALEGALLMERMLIGAVGFEATLRAIQSGLAHDRA